MGFFGVVLKPGQKEAIAVPPGWCLQLCTAALEPSGKQGKKAQDVSATLWMQVEGEIGDTSYLIGTLQAGGACAQMPVGHCLTSVDGEIIVEAKGSANIHLTGFFNREFDPDLENDGFSDESSEEEESEESEEISEEGEGDEEAGPSRGKNNQNKKNNKNGGSDASVGAGESNGRTRSLRSAAVVAAAACGTGGDLDSEDDSEVDGEYLPGGGDDSDGGDGGDEDDDGDGDGGGGNGVKEEEEKSGGARNGKAGFKRSKAEADSSKEPPSKKSKPDEKNKEDGEESGSELTKQERRRQRKRENKRKAAEAKRGLEEAFSAMDDDEKEPPVGIPLKNPRTKTLKGGLKIKDTTLGGGKLAVPGKNVKLCYEGCFPDGHVFDKNQNRRRPLQFRIGMKSVILGMDRGVEGMRVGGSREIYIPASLGYGARGTGPIPANQDLVFRVEMVDVLGK